MAERDWDTDFELSAWQAQDRVWRKKWIEEAWRRERDEVDVCIIRRQRYERGQTAWDIGLDPLLFDATLSEAVDQVKPEHWDGVLFGDRDVRHRVLSALLANAGLRRTLRLAPPEARNEALAKRAACAAWQRALALDHASGTHSAGYEPPPALTPVIRAEFVTVPEADAVLWSFNRAKCSIAEPFQWWDRAMASASGDEHQVRVLDSGYLVMGDHSLPRSDLLVLRKPWGKTWPTVSETALIVHIANTHATLLFDWYVRRPTYLDAGALETWVIDTIRKRLFRQRRGEESAVTRYTDTGQIVTWQDEAGVAVAVELRELFGESFASAGASEMGDVFPDADAFTEFNTAQRLERFDTPWTIGHTPQWFSVSIGSILGRFKDELWDGVLFGPEHLRDQILSALLANVGLHDVLRLAPIQLWQQAMAEIDQSSGPISLKELANEAEPLLDSAS